MNIRLEEQPAISRWQGVVRMQDRYDTEIDDVWSALSDPRRLARWIGEVEGDLRLGGEFHGRFTTGWDGTGRVEKCEPPRLLLTMDLGQPGENVIEATPAADGPGGQGRLAAQSPMSAVIRASHARH